MFLHIVGYKRTVQDGENCEAARQRRFPAQKERRDIEGLEAV